MSRCHTRLPEFRSAQAIQLSRFIERAAKARPVITTAPTVIPMARGVEEGEARKQLLTGRQPQSRLQRTGRATQSLDRGATATSKPVAVQLPQRCEQAVYRPSEAQKQTGTAGSARKSRPPCDQQERRSQVGRRRSEKTPSTDLKTVVRKDCGFESHALRKTSSDLLVRDFVPRLLPREQRSWEPLSQVLGVPDSSYRIGVRREIGPKDRERRRIWQPFGNPALHPQCDGAAARAEPEEFHAPCRARDQA
jgi:hypothetical protein